MNAIHYLIMFVLLFCAGTAPVSTDTLTLAEGLEEDQVAQEIIVPNGPLLLDITLKRIYLDGEQSEEHIQETIWALEDFWAKYESWQLVDMDEDRLVFEMEVEDISPLLKMNGYFGLTDEGLLSVYNGKPDQAQIIQSFFQIDMDKLEGHQQTEFRKGIPVKSKEGYQDVLRTMSQLQVDK